MSKVTTTYDGAQHCVARKDPGGKSVAMDCPYTGKGEELSPTNMVESALAACMLLSMGTLAMRSKIDLSGTKVEVAIGMREGAKMRFGSIDVTVAMPPGLSETDRKKLERAAEACPIKHSFAEDVPVNVTYNYPV
jgi:putative redox protein